MVLHKMLYGALCRLHGRVPERRNLYGTPSRLGVVAYRIEGLCGVFGNKPPPNHEQMGIVMGRTTPLLILPASFGSDHAVGLLVSPSYP